MATLEKKVSATEFIFALTVNDYFASFPGEVEEFLKENSEYYADADSHFCDITVYTAPVDDDERFCESCDDEAELPFFYQEQTNVCTCVSHLPAHVRAFIEAHIS